MDRWMDDGWISWWRKAQESGWSTEREEELNEVEQWKMKKQLKYR